MLPTTPIHSHTFTKLALVVGIVLGINNASAPADIDSCPWSTIDGGTSQMTGGSYALIGTAGQYDAGPPHMSGRYGLMGGHWAWLEQSFNGAPLGSPLPLPDSCAADIAPAPAGDNIVNVADLLMVINRWGATWGAGGVPQGDITCNGIVNVEDLLAVITAWGACPN